MSDVATISVSELAQRAEQGPVDLIDVRTPAEFREARVKMARNVPLETLDVQAVAGERNGRDGEPLYVICLRGGRAGQACRKLMAAGLTQVINVEGGTQAWIDAGLPVIRGQKTISLERQVRMIAGLLVLVGAGLGYFVHPYFIALSAFVGAGLMFAGMTDTCGMAMLLARMPWNQRGGEKCCSQTPG